jgi:hypothetical protein
VSALKKLSDASLVLYGSSLIIIIFLVGYFFPFIADAPALRAGSWLIIIILMSAFAVLLGLRISGRPAGVFINERYKMSLSRFQLVVWTIIVLSAFVTIALGRVQAYSVDPSYFADPLIPDPLAIEVPSQLWALLGISTASLIGSPLVLSPKKSKTPTTLALVRAAQIASTKEDVSNDKNVKAAKSNYDQAAVSNANISIMRSARDKWEKAILAAQKGRVQSLLTTYQGNVQVQGTLSSNTDPSKAEFSEIFRGDEVGNQNVIDMAKVQMFFFTILIVFSYAVMLMMLLLTTEPAAITKFPELTEATIALLGISSGGYLANKAPDKTKTM